MSSPSERIGQLEALASVATGAPRSHVIWGNIEPASTSSDVQESSSSQHLPSQEGDGEVRNEIEFRGEEQGSSETAMGEWWHRVPRDVRMYVNSHVAVNNDESDSTPSLGKGAEQSPHAADGAEGGQARRTQGGAGSADSQDESAQSEEDSQEGFMWSRGSARHKEGKCRPCHYVHTPAGCLHGEECDFCHMVHRRKNRPRPHRRKRMQCKKYADMLEDAEANNPEMFKEAIEGLGSRSAYLQSIVFNRFRNKDGEEGQDAGHPSGAASSSTSMAAAASAALHPPAPVPAPRASGQKQLVSL